MLPVAKGLSELGPIGFQSILAQDPQRLSVAGLMLDIAQALLQHGVGYEALATDAFQEVVSDLYDGFLSAEDRGSVEPPDYGVIAPNALLVQALAGRYAGPRVHMDPYALLVLAESHTVQ